MSKSLFDKFDPIDVIALVVMTGCIITMTIRGDTVFKDILTTVVGFYFGRNTGKPNPPPSNGKVLIIIFLILIISI